MENTKSRHDHKRGAPLVDDFDNWCKVEYAGSETEPSNHSIRSDGILNMVWSSGVTLKHGAWSASHGICEEIKRTFPSAQYFKVSIVVTPITTPATAEE